nr:reverse transcriptase domain-containing protein [Tanacetum cinerariifolium]
MEGVLYKRSFLTPWLRCVGPLQAEYVMREIHEGSCSMHAGPRSIVAKAVRLGYYWPTMHRDARDMIRKCSDCQIHRPVTRHPQQPLTPITAPWPFYKWGNRHSRPLSGGAGEGQIPDSRHGLLHKVDRSKGGGNDYRRADNGKQFADNLFKDWCDKLNITQRFASVKHLQSKGLVERANKSLGEGIKARLGEGNKNWVEELPHVLWAHRTMIKSSHGDTLFSLTYGTEAVIPAEIGMPTYRTAAVDVVNNDEELRLNLDLLEEGRELAAVSEAKSKSKMMKYYNARVRGVAFKPRDFVYRSNDDSHAVAGGTINVTKLSVLKTSQRGRVYQQKGKTLRDHRRYRHRDAIRPGVMCRANPWEHPLLAVGTYTASVNSLLAVGMPCAFYSQQSSSKLDAPSALKMHKGFTVAGSRLVLLDKVDATAEVLKNLLYVISAVRVNVNDVRVILVLLVY